MGEKVKILNFYGIYDTDNYLIVQTTASNIAIQHKYTKRILNLRY